MGALSRNTFIRKWIWRDGASQLGRADQTAAIADLDALISYSGGNIATAKTLTLDEKAAGEAEITDEELARRT